MGKLWKDFVKKCYEQTLYTAQLILDYKDTATIIVVENNNPEYEELKKKAVAAKSDILPVFKDGILISYERDVKHENFEIMPGVQQAQTYTSYSSLVYYYESSIDNDVVSNRFEVLCVEFGMMGDDDMVANTNGEIIFDVIKKGCTNIQKDKNKKMIGLILAGYSSVIEIPGCVGISIYGRGSYEFTYPPDRNYSDNFNISTKYGSIPATYLAQKGLSQDEVIEMLEKTFIYIKEDELLIVRSIMEMYMRSTNYLIDHPEEKIRKKKATKTSSVVQESRSPDSKSDKANTEDGISLMKYIKVKNNLDVSDMISDATAMNTILNEYSTKYVDALNNIEDDVTLMALLLQGLEDLDTDDAVYHHFCEDIKNNNFTSSAEIIKYITSLDKYDLDYKVTTDNKSGITLTTAHSSKGLEWKAVLVDIMDFKFNTISSSSEYQELMRLLYVSITRAQELVGVFGNTEIIKKVS